jgi:hypothetical protein
MAAAFTAAETLAAVLGTGTGREIMKSHGCHVLKRWDDKSGGYRSSGSFNSMNFLASKFHDFSAGTKAGQGRQGSLDDIRVIAGTQGLGEHITDAHGFHDGADTPTGDHTGTG